MRVPGYLSVEEAAERLGVKPQRIRKLAYDGRFLGAVKVSGVWLIPVGDVEGFRKLKPGRPKKEQARRRQRRIRREVALAL